MDKSQRLDLLEAENELLRGLLAASATHLPFEWELTPSESKIMGALLSGRVISRDHMKNLLWWDRDEPEDADAVLDVFLSKLRRKMKRSDVDVVCRYGVGYHLDPPGKQVVIRWLT